VDGRIEFVNRYYCEFFGTTVDAVRLGGWQPLVHPDDLEESTRALATAMREQRSFRRAGRVRRADGAWRWIDSSCVPRFDTAGRFIGMLGCSPDITEQKLAEEMLLEQLRHNELLIDVLNHDLRAPLATVAIGVEVALATAESPTARAALELIASSAQNMRRLVEQLLDVTQLRSSHGLSMRRVRTDLVAIVRATIDELSPAHPRATCTVESSGDPWCDCDPVLLRQLIANLLGNALTHGHSSQRVRVRVDGSEPAWVRLSVHDEGVIAPALLEVVFEPLKQASAGSGERVGLGLYIVNQIALAHDAKVRVDSDAARGTTFEVALPRS
jgi:two-component system, sensor histidine kinase and response regulator